jgi:hypothetical protein
MHDENKKILRFPQERVRKGQKLLNKATKEKVRSINSLHWKGEFTRPGGTRAVSTNRNTREQSASLYGLLSYFMLMFFLVFFQNLELKYFRPGTRYVMKRLLRLKEFF